MHALKKLYTLLTLHEEDGFSHFSKSLRNSKKPITAISMKSAWGYKPMSRLLKKSMKEGCSKKLGCKACEIMRHEAYFPYAAMKHDEHNAADERFSTAC
jgi:hypothetical protein